MIQTTLELYDKTEKSEVYHSLEALGIIKNQKNKILTILWDLEPHDSEEFLKAGIKQYNARIKELREDDGYEIPCFRTGSGLKFFFRLQTRTRRWNQ